MSLDRDPVVAPPDLFDDAGTVDGVRDVSLVRLRRLEAAAGRPRDLLDLENLPAAE